MGNKKCSFDGWLQLAWVVCWRTIILLSLGNDQERGEAGKLSERLGERVVVLPALSLKHFCALLKQFDLAVSGSTGPRHLAGRKKTAKGLDFFIKQFPDACPVILTTDNFPLFSENPKKFLAAL